MRKKLLIGLKMTEKSLVESVTFYTRLASAVAKACMGVNGA